MYDFIETAELEIPGSGETFEVTAKVSLITERGPLEPFSDGRSRGTGEWIEGAQLDQLIVGPLSYDRAGAVDLIGLDAVVGFEDRAIEAAVA